jgi:drug/metabolite transporter (DMT)-like permease
LLGVITLTEPWTGTVDPVGIALALLAGVGWGSYILLTQHVGERFTGISGLTITVPSPRSPPPSSASQRPAGTSPQGSSPPRSGSACSTP